MQRGHVVCGTTPEFSPRIFCSDLAFYSDFTDRPSPSFDVAMALKSTSAPSGSTAYMLATCVLTDAFAVTPTDPNVSKSMVAITVASPKESVFIDSPLDLFDGASIDWVVSDL